MNDRAEKRSPAAGNSSVEFTPGISGMPYHFKLRDFSAQGFGILVRKDSKVLDFLKPGDILAMKYYSGQERTAPVPYQAEIKHISSPEEGKFEGHLIVGLLLIDESV